MEQWGKQRLGRNPGNHALTYSQVSSWTALSKLGAGLASPVTAQLLLSSAEADAAAMKAPWAQLGRRWLGADVLGEAWGLLQRWGGADPGWVLGSPQKRPELQLAPLLSL